MDSQILTKINSFVKKRLIEISGILIILASVFFLTSIITYSPGDPNFIYSPENVDIKNIGGFYGSVIADFLLQSIGLISIFFVNTQRITRNVFYLNLFVKVLKHKN